MGIRDIKSGRQIKEAMIRDNSKAKIDAMELDLSSMESVRNFTTQFNSCGLTLNILINNAGIMATPFKLSEDNIELQFATNHIDTHTKLEHFRRLPVIFHSKCTEGGRNSVNRGEAKRRAHFYRANTTYNSLSAYGQSKLANVLHAKELARLLKVEGVYITANSLHPGAIATNLFRHHSLIDGLVGLLGKYVMKNTQKGAATTCYVALHRQVKGTSGCYFADCNVAETSLQASDPVLARKLWDFSSDLIPSRF